MTADSQFLLIVYAIAVAGLIGQVVSMRNGLRIFRE